MSDILDFLVQIFISFSKEIIETPGAFTIWMLKGFRTKYKNELKHSKRNMIVGGLVWLLLIALVVLLISYWVSK